MPSRSHRVTIAFAVTLALLLSGVRPGADGPAPIPPVNNLPNPYETVRDYLKLPGGRTMGSTAAVDIDKDGKSIWLAERCGANTCLQAGTTTIQNMPPILKFDEKGNVLKAFGEGLVVQPHGIHVDRDGNVWVTDGSDNVPPVARGAAPAGAARGAAPAPTPTPPVPNAAATKGHQVFKFSPDGKLLLTLGKPGGASAPDYFFTPNDVLVAPNGDIFVCEGHSSIPGATARLLKFDKTGKFIKAWGRWGNGDGEFDQPHSLAMDSRGRLFVADRGNNRLQIFDQDGKLLDKWYQFSRPSGVFIDKKDNLYVADSESMSISKNHDGWKRGIRVGSAKDGKVVAFIPDPDEKATGTSAAEGVAADAAGNIFGAEVGPRAVKRYVKRQ